jgi:hypothetical protein
MTSDLTQTALDFCRECLGWEDVIALPEDSIMDEAVVIVRGDTDSALYYTDLNAVMEAVRRWCDSKSYRLEIASNQGACTPAWLVRIRCEGEDRGFQARDVLGEALLAACVEVSRKLKVAA